MVGPPPDTHRLSAAIVERASLSGCRSRLELFERRGELRVVGGKPNRLGEIGDGEFAIAVGIPSQRPSVAESGAFCVQADRFGEIGDRPVKIVFLDPAATQKTHVTVVANTAAQIIILRPRRIAADRLVEIGDGVLRIALGDERLAAGVIRVGEIRICTDRAGEIGNRAVELGLGFSDKPAIVCPAE